MQEGYPVPFRDRCLFGLFVVAAVVLIVYLAGPAQWLGAVACVVVGIVAVAILAPWATASVASSLAGIVPRVRGK